MMGKFSSMTAEQKNQAMRNTIEKIGYDGVEKRIIATLGEYDDMLTEHKAEADNTSLPENLRGVARRNYAETAANRAEVEETYRLFLEIQSDSYVMDKEVVELLESFGLKDGVDFDSGKNKLPR